MRKFSFITALGLCLLLAAGCEKDTQPTNEGSYYHNVFAVNCMNAYYLWTAEIQSALKGWNQYEKDPIGKLQTIRYKDDKWTALYNDISVFEQEISGDGNTFGADFELIQVGSDVFLQTRYVYADSPAAKKGMKRGDRFSHVEGAKLTRDNAVSLVTYALRDARTQLKLGTDENPESLVIDAENMYCNPVQTVKVLQEGDKTIGYVHYTNFTMPSAKALEDCFRSFKDDGITDLVLDLRYNGGGYSVVSNAIGCMLAPIEDVQAGRIFTQNNFNAALQERMSGDAVVFNLQPVYEMTDEFTIDAAAVNPGLTDLWVITTGETASASEMLIGSLMPYLNVHTVGEKTCGKFCGGYLITAEQWYDALAESDPDLKSTAEGGKRATKGWGIYVIASRYADCNGLTASMPDGIEAYYPAKDNPHDGYALGDPRETMLAATLRAMGVSSAATPSAVRSAAQLPERRLERPAALIPANSGMNILPLR